MSSQMVLKLQKLEILHYLNFRSMSSQMVLKRQTWIRIPSGILDLCHLKWY